MKAAAVGAAYLGKFEQIPESKVVDVLWEARQPAESCKTFKQLQVSLVGGKMTPVKPKLHLTATVVLEPGAWFQLR